MKLFNINQYKIDTENLSGLHGTIVEEFENKIANFVGAKYACGVSSATNAIFLSLLDKNTKVTVPSMIPPVVCNAIITSNNIVDFSDNVDWVGDSYILHRFANYKIIDSAQKIEKDQFKKEANAKDLMIFSFYPTKPIGSFDGGMIVSNDKEKIDYFKLMCMNGSTFDKKSWKRSFTVPGYKMYLNSFQAYIADKNFQVLGEKYNVLDKIRDFYNQELGLKNTSRHLYRIRIKNRNELFEKALLTDIELGIHYEAAHLNPIYNRINLDLPLSVIDAGQVVSIPFNEKMSLKDAEMVLKFVKKNGLIHKVH